MSLRRPDVGLPREAVELALVGGVLVGVAALVGIAYRGALVTRLNGSVTVFLGAIAGGSLLYGWLRGFEVGLSPPALEELPTAVGLAVLPALVAMALAAAAPLVGVSVVDVTGQSYAPRSSPVTVLARTAVPAVVTGVGYAALSTLAVQAPVRKRVTARTGHVVAAATAALLFFRVVLQDLAVTMAGYFAAWRAAIGAVLAVGTVATGLTAGVVYLGACDRSLETVYRPVLVPAYALALVVLVGTAVVLAAFPDVLGHGLWAVGFAAAAWGYERTRSVWVPAAALASLELSLALLSWAATV